MAFKVKDTPKNLQQVVEEMQQHISKLKTELEAEKVYNKQLQREKVAKAKQLQEYVTREQDDAVKSGLLIVDCERQDEFSRLKESLCKEKDAEVRELFNQHKEQVKQLQNRLTIKNEANFVC